MELLEHRSMEFETAYKRLEEILEKMNSQNLSLEESLKLYKEADELVRHCSKKLASAEEQIQTIVKNRNQELELDQNGQPLLKEL